MEDMTTEIAAGHIPQLTLGWRLQMSLQSADLGVKEMADYLDVDRNTVSRWLHDKNEPPRAAILAWAMKTGVPLPWIESGIAPNDYPDGGSSADTDSSSGSQVPPTSSYEGWRPALVAA